MKTNKIINPNCDKQNAMGEYNNDVQEFFPPYQFAFHDRVSPTPPTLDIFDLIIEKGVENLTREEKNNIFHRLQSNDKTTYKLGGWAFPFKQFLKRYAVKYTHSGGFSEIFAFDKTCIRYSFYTNSNISEIIELPKH